MKHVVRLYAIGVMTGKYAISIVINDTLSFNSEPLDINSKKEAKEFMKNLINLFVDKRKSNIELYISEPDAFTSGREEIPVDMFEIFNESHFLN